jgi:hypothetical protein
MGAAPKTHKNPVLDRLLAAHRLVRAPRLQPDGRVLSTGLADLDAHLPEHGYPRGALTELVGTGPRHSLALHALAAASRHHRVAYLARGVVLHPEVLLARGAALEHCHCLLEERPEPLFWAAHQLLASGLFPLLLLYGSDWRDGTPLLGPLAWRRLLGLAKRHDAVVLLILDRHPALDAFARPCALRLQVEAGGWRPEAGATPQNEQRTSESRASKGRRPEAGGNAAPPQPAAGPPRGGHESAEHAGRPGRRICVRVVRAAGHSPGDAFELEI